MGLLKHTADFNVFIVGGILLLLLMLIIFVGFIIVSHFVFGYAKQKQNINKCAQVHKKNLCYFSGLMSSVDLVCLSGFFLLYSPFLFS